MATHLDGMNSMVCVMCNLTTQWTITTKNLVFGKLNRKLHYRIMFHRFIPNQTRIQVNFLNSVLKLLFTNTTQEYLHHNHHKNHINVWHRYSQMFMCLCVPLNHIYVNVSNKIYQTLYYPWKIEDIINIIISESI